jgi:hypothetical protein
MVVAFHGNSTLYTGLLMVLKGLRCYIGLDYDISWKLYYSTLLKGLKEGGEVLIYMLPASSLDFISCKLYCGAERIERGRRGAPLYAPRQLFRFHFV